MEILKEIKKGIKDIQKNRFKFKLGYKVDTWIFKLVTFLGLMYLLFVAFNYNFDLDYFKCTSGSDGSISGNKLMLNNFIPDNKDGYCKNPFYKQLTWKNEKYLPPGEYGTKLGADFNYASLVVVGIIIIGIILNHLLNNRNSVYLKRL